MKDQEEIKEQAESIVDEQQQEEEQPEQNGSDEAEELVISIEGDEEQEPEEDATPLIKKLRQAHREAKRQTAELKAEIEKLKQSGKQESGVAPALEKPTLESCGYDADKFESALAEWFDRKRQEDDKKAEALRKDEEARKSWESTVAQYTEKKTALGKDDFDDAEDLVRESLSTEKIGIILKGIADPAAFIYAIGKSSTALKKLAEIDDMVIFAREIFTLERNVKVTTKKTPPPPEKRVVGNTGVSPPASQQLEKALEKARKTGDATELYRLQRQMKK